MNPRFWGKTQRFGVKPKSWGQPKVLSLRFWGKTQVLGGNPKDLEVKPRSWGQTQGSEPAVLGENPKFWGKSHGFGYRTEIFNPKQSSYVSVPKEPKA